tara:strand:+ start:3077 stop:3313 length:237 start_codon:yes stop_codon:yes gene_type:complete
MILSGITGLVLGCAITILYLNKRFNSIKTLLEDKLLVNDLLKRELTALTCCKEEASKKSANKNKRRTYKKKPKKQLDK